MKTLLSLLAVSLLAGCSTSYVRKGDLKAFNSRFIWATEGFKASYTTNGATIEIQRTNPDAVTAAAITDAAVSAAVKSAKP